MALTGARKRLLEAAREAAMELGDKGRGLTHLIGELPACEQANLAWEPSDGYDAKSGQRRVQIKTRKSWSTPKVNPAGRMGRFGRKKGYLFDIAMYVELDDNFDTLALWQMTVDEVKVLEENESSGRGLHVRTFKGNAHKIYG